MKLKSTMDEINPNFEYGLSMIEQVMIKLDKRDFIKDKIN